MAGRGLLSACLGGAVASFGCSALLDLDVQYTDAGSEGETGAAASVAEASSETHPDVDSTAPEAANRDGDSDAGTSPGVPDGLSPDVSNEAPPAPPIQWVQDKAGSNNYVGATVTLMFDHPVTLNDTIVVAADGMTTSLDAPTDSRGNQFSSASSVLNGNSGAWIFYAPVVNPGADSITVALPGNPSGPLLNVYALEYSHVTALDAVNGQNGTTSDMHSGFVTTTAPGDLIFGYGVVFLGSSAAGTGFTPRATVHNNLTEDEIAPDPGKVEATGTLITGNTWTMMVAAFKAR
ncbi:MAG TPA: hypothetical protein VK762_32905 [Polyangiaceae bacterium]|jgi:hypothetical protein|nr:hypothetical protein [Polyangiaceae bacterium]